MKKLRLRVLIASITTFILLYSVAMTVSADSITINGTITTDIFERPTDEGTCAAVDFGDAYLDIIQFEVDESGTYVLETLAASFNDTVLILYNGLYDPANPLVGCIENNDDGGAGLLSKITQPLEAGSTYSVVVTSFGNFDTGTYTLNISGPGGICLPSCAVPTSNDLPAPAFTDGRINNYDSAAPVAVYPVQIAGETGLHIYNPDGVLLLTVAPQVLIDAPSNPAVSVLLGEGNGVTVWRIAGEGQGYWQVNAPQYNGKTYVLIFGELFPDVGYTSYEEN